MGEGGAECLDINEMYSTNCFRLYDIFSKPNKQILEIGGGGTD